MRRKTLPSTWRFGTHCGPRPDAGATSAHVRLDSPVVFGHLSGAWRARAAHLIQLKEDVEAQVARYPGRVTFARIPREQNGVADELAKDGARGLQGAKRRSSAIGSASSARTSDWPGARAPALADLADTRAALATRHDEQSAT
jgi:hypothetical protein